jgi:branched-chain amino acid transport system substrate-binding protein
MRKARARAAGAATLTGVLLLAGCGGGPSGGGGTISGDKIVLAVLNDQSGVYSDLSGSNSVEAVRMAVEDFKAEYGDKAVTKNIDVVTADHQNKPEVANSKAQELYDREGADVILDVPTSSAALAVATVANQKKKVYLNITAATTDLTGKSCNKYTFHYAYDTWQLAHGTGTTVTEQGGKNWYIVYPDYAFGQDMQKSFTAAIEAAGGRVIGSDPTPFPNDNFSTFLLKAPNLTPKPDVLGTMQAGGDLINLVKQYNEFGLRDKGTKLSVGLMFITDIHSLGPDAFAGTTFTDAWYWNLDQRSRQWADRFQLEFRSFGFGAAAWVRDRV